MISAAKDHHAGVLPSNQMNYEWTTGALDLAGQRASNATLLPTTGKLAVNNGHLSASWCFESLQAAVRLLVPVRRTSGQHKAHRAKLA